MPKSSYFNRYRNLPDIIQEGRQIHTAPDTHWYTVWPAGSSGDQVSDGTSYETAGPKSVQFQNGWLNVGEEGDPPAGFYLSEKGEVRLRGHITGAPATVIFTLPEECRPEFNEKFVVAADDGHKAHIIVRQNGEVYCESITD